MLNTLYKVVGVGGMVGGVWALFGFHLYIAVLVSDGSDVWAVIALLTPPLAELYWLYHEFTVSGLVSGWTECLLLLLLIYMTENACIQRWQYREDHGLD